MKRLAQVLGSLGHAYRLLGNAEKDERYTLFYRQLKREPSLSKAQALKEVQLKILQEHDRYKHPFFWSPFLLIGNRL
jgi:hypothetical protein